MKGAFWRRCLTPTIQKKLLLVMLAVALTPVGIFGVIAWQRVSETFINQTGDKLLSTSSQALAQIDRTFSFTRENVTSWSRLDVMQEVATGDPNNHIGTMLEDYQNAYGVFSTLVAVNASGQVIAAGDSDLKGVSVAGTDWFHQVMRNRAPAIGHLRLDPVLGGYGIKIVMPIFKKFGNGEVIGAVAASFDWAELLHLVSAINVADSTVNVGQTPSAYALLMDREGYIIAAPDFILAEDDGSAMEADSLRVFGKRWWVAEMPSLLSQMLSRPGYRYIKRSGKEWLVVSMPSTQFSTLSNMGWSLVLVRDANEALAGLDFVRERAIWVGCIAVVILFLVAWTFARHISAPIQRLSEWAKTLSPGNLDARLDVVSADEIGDLGRVLDDMRHHLKVSMDEISNAKERYQAVLDSIDCIVWEAQISPIRMLLVSGKVESVLGITNDDASEEKVSEWLLHWREWVHPDYHKALSQAFSHAITNAQDTFVQFQARHQNGNWVWFKAFISVVISGIRVVGLRGVMVDITDVYRAKEEVQKARDLAVSTAENKSRFLAIVSHEIRTPMNGLLGMLDLLRENNGLNDEQKDTLQVAWQSGRNLLSLVDDVMDFNRIEAGEMQFHYERTNIHELLNAALTMVAADAYKRGLDVGLVLESNLPELVVCDAVKVRRILANLLSNAVKFTQHGSVLLWAEMLPGNRLYVEVKDTGVGIGAQEQQQLFQAFVLGDSSSTRRHGGSGLGLVLAQRILEAMNGRIGVKSIKGLGSSFYFELPVDVIGGQESPRVQQRLRFQREHAGAAVLLIGDLPATQIVMQLAAQHWELGFHWEPKESRVLRHLDEILNARDYHWIFIAQEMSERFWEKMAPYMQSHPRLRIVQLRLPAEKHGQRPLPHIYVPFSDGALADVMLAGRRETEKTAQLIASQTPSKRLLVVDDNEVNRKVACGFLRKLGYEADTAENGQEALDAVLEKDYGLILMDCQMPVMDGYEATRQIKALPKGKYLPIIAVTANAMEGDRDKCLAAGMDDYTTKPIRREKLQELLNHWLHPDMQSLA
ncbi:putative response regulator receiver [gamma proteobacterium HdN1]|nr:putative response regulator receiver [gamma proteobacterium HdN1]